MSDTFRHEVEHLLLPAGIPVTVIDQIVELAAEQTVALRAALKGLVEEIGRVDLSVALALLAEPEGQRAAEEWRALDELASGVGAFARMFASRLEQLQGPREVVASVRSGVGVLANRLAAVERARQEATR